MSVSKIATYWFRPHVLGFLPVPALIIITYCIFWQMIHYAWLCAMPIPRIYEFWSLPQVVGLSLLDLFFYSNVLLWFYLFISIWSFATNREKSRKLPFHQKVSYLLSLVLLLTMQGYIHKIDSEFQLPDKILELRTGEFQPLVSRGLEDLLLPESELCQGYANVHGKRYTLTIPRHGHLVKNRIDYGAIDQGPLLLEIEQDLRSKAEEAGRQADGSSELILHLRVDRDAKFKPVNQLIRLCNEPEIRINRIELGCRCDLMRREPEAFQKIKGIGFYMLPEGRLNYRLPGPLMDHQGDASSSESPDRVTANVYLRESEGKQRTLVIELDEGPLDDPNLLEAFYKRLSLISKRDSEASVTIRVHPDVPYGHVLQVYTECLRAGIAHLLFK